MKMLVKFVKTKSINLTKIKINYKFYKISKRVHLLGYFTVRESFCVKIIIRLSFQIYKEIG